MRVLMFGDVVGRPGRVAVLERELASVRRELGALLDEKDRLEGQVERLLSERDTIRTKVEAMLDAIAVLDPEAVEVMRR